MVAELKPDEVTRELTAFGDALTRMPLELLHFSLDCDNTSGQHTLCDLVWKLPTLTSLEIEAEEDFLRGFPLVIAPELTKLHLNVIAGHLIEHAVNIALASPKLADFEVYARDEPATADSLVAALQSSMMTKLTNLCLALHESTPATLFSATCGSNTLRKLDIGLPSHYSHHDIAKALRSIRALEELEFSVADDGDVLTGEAYQSDAVVTVSSLRTLKFGVCFSQWLKGVVFTNVHRVSIEELRNFSSLNVLFEACPNLSHLTLPRYSSSLTTGRVWPLLKNLKFQDDDGLVENVATLRLSFPCAKIFCRDAELC